MSLSSRFHTSWQLLQSSVHVLRRNRRLLLFPLISLACALVMIAFFLAPMLYLGIGSSGSEEMFRTLGDRMNAVSVAYGAIIYLTAMFVGTFFNVAFYHQILGAFAGEPVSVRAGLGFARSRIGAIAMWSLLAGTIGWVIRAIEERLGWIGKIIMGLVGIAWSVAAVFAIPVIIRREDSNPLAVLRDSAATLKKTWGESLVGFLGIRMTGVILAGVMIVFILFETVAMFVFEPFWPLVVLNVVWFLVFFAAMFVVHIATDVYRCALYVYATEGVVPEPYTPELMDAAWKVKKS
ncbi:MAG TPA: DUF6159 family protein [Opitutaceae bacterium]|nr:DUF6159 family protein [Opitutaceae bacterium]